jgi:hypothetical protein
MYLGNRLRPYRQTHYTKNGKHLRKDEYGCLVKFDDEHTGEMNIGERITVMRDKLQERLDRISKKGSVSSLPTKESSTPHSPVTTVHYGI